MQILTNYSTAFGGYSKCHVTNVSIPERVSSFTALLVFVCFVPFFFRRFLFFFFCFLLVFFFYILVFGLGLFYFVLFLFFGFSFLVFGFCFAVPYNLTIKTLMETQSAYELSNSRPLEQALATAFYTISQYLVIELLFVFFICF